jgi:uncharacterized protein YqfB (UPF0267 family)
MLTKWYRINVSEKDRDILLQMQQNYSYAFRKIYNNMDLTQDKSFIKEIRDKYGISSKTYEYLVKECDSFYKRNKASVENRKKQIEQLRSKMSEEKDVKKRIKVNKRIIGLCHSLKGGVVFGGKVLMKTLQKGNENKEKYRKNRILPLCFYGETSRSGNRFFNLKGLSDGFILFKYEGSNIKINIELCLKKNDVIFLKQLERLALAKQCAITIRLTTERIYITYDEAQINENKFDEKKVYESIKHITNKDERKKLIRQAHVDFENKLLFRKNKNRFLSVDMNPDGIGYSVLEKKSDSADGDFSVLKKEYLDFSHLNKESTNKRKYELSIAIRYLFNQLTHYNCAYFVSEELSNLGTGDNGNRISNRKINNLWNREYIDNLFTKYCNIRGIKRIEINPAYSSFIGNINYETYDPIASSIEIGRRGIIKYIRGARIIPEFCMSNIVDGLAKRLSLSKKIYDNIYECKTWKELYKAFSTAKMSVRRKANDFAFSETYLENEKSTVKKLCFL